MIKNYFLWLFKFITVLFLLVFIVPVIFIAIGSSLNMEQKVQSNKVAVVELTGPIYQSREVIDELYAQIDNPKVDGIVLRIDSPGGAVGPSQEIYSAVKKLKQKKPIVASMGSVAASGGLYSALAASKIYCQPGTLTGSIGVIMELPNLKTVAEKVGFAMTTIKSGELKDAGNMFREMNEYEKNYLQQVAAQTHADFMLAVSEGRSISLEKVKTFADGRVIIGRQAKDLGLVDEMGDVYDAAREVYKILGKPLAADSEAKLFYPQDKFKEFKEIFGGVKSLIRTFSHQPTLSYLWMPAG